MTASEGLRVATDLTGKRALVTGGTSGIGFAVAVLFAAAGADVWICGTRDGQALAKGIGVRFVRYDASTGGEDDLIAAVTADGAPLDVLVANAGVYETAPAERITDERLERVLGINLLSVGRLLTRAPAAMPRGGSVIVTSSTGAAYAAPGELAYGASKAGVEGLVRVAAREYAARRIRVNSVRPGPILTPMTPPGAADGVGLAIPMQRMGTPEELAHLYLFLASDACTFLTGASINVDGGETLGLPPGLSGGA